MRFAATGLAALVALASAAVPATAATVPVAANTAVAAVPAAERTRTPAPSVPVASLRATGARTDVVVRGLRRSAQARWVDHVVQDRLVSLDGCLPDPSAYTFRRGVYRSRVYTLCAGGVAQARRAAAAVTASRPWYSVKVTSVPVVAFTFTTDLGVGRGEPVGAAMAKLPFNDFTYLEGDDVSMVYVGQRVGQAQLDAARAAFARELQIGVGRVTVAPLRF